MRLPILSIAAISVFIMMAGCSQTPPPPEGNAESDPLTQGQQATTRQTRIQQRETKTSNEAPARRARSIAVLRAESVPFLEELPVIETEAKSTRRTTEQVALRAMALCTVAVKGEGLEQVAVDKMVADYKLESAFTPQELAFVKNKNPTEDDRVQFAWRYECYWVMLWALGYVDKLERPDKISDVKTALSILRESGRDKFMKKAQLRPQRELLDAADLIYRYHWATVDARINNREAPAGLDEGVVTERHHALNWLIGHLGQAWDEVPTDT